MVYMVRLCGFRLSAPLAATNTGCADAAPSTERTGNVFSKKAGVAISITVIIDDSDVYTPIIPGAWWLFIPLCDALAGTLVDNKTGTVV